MEKLGFENFFLFFVTFSISRCTVEVIEIVWTFCMFFNFASNFHWLPVKSTPVKSAQNTQSKAPQSNATWDLGVGGPGNFKLGSVSVRFGPENRFSTSVRFFKVYASWECREILLSTCIKCRIIFEKTKKSRTLHGKFCKTSLHLGKSWKTSLLLRETWKTSMQFVETWKNIN